MENRNKNQTKALNGLVFIEKKKTGHKKPSHEKQSRNFDIVYTRTQTHTHTLEPTRKSQEEKLFKL